MDTATTMIWFDFGGVLSPPIDKLFEVYYKKVALSQNSLKMLCQM